MAPALPRITHAACLFLLPNASQKKNTVNPKHLLNTYFFQVAKSRAAAAAVATANGRI